MSQHQEDASLQACLDALFYEDGECRPLTVNTLQLINESKEKLGEASSLFIEGTLRFLRDALPFEVLSQAEEKGCDHPTLHYLLGKCYVPVPAPYQRVEKGVVRNPSKALEHYSKAIKGRCILVVLHHIVDLYTFSIDYT